MSRYYKMQLHVADCDPQNIEAIKEASKREWDFSEWEENEDSIDSEADGFLRSGEGEEEFAHRLAESIWVANGGFCEVEVDATWLDNVPCQSHAFDEEDFRRANLLTQNKKNETSHNKE